MGASRAETGSAWNLGDPAGRRCQRGADPPGESSHLLGEAGRPGRLSVVNLSVWGISRGFLLLLLERPTAEEVTFGSAAWKSPGEGVAMITDFYSLSKPLCVDPHSTVMFWIERGVHSLRICFASAKATCNLGGGKNKQQQQSR